MPAILRGRLRDVPPVTVVGYTSETSVRFYCLRYCPVRIQHVVVKTGVEEVPQDADPAPSFFPYSQEKSDKLISQVGDTLNKTE
jgi:hypothetical protein